MDEFTEREISTVGIVGCNRAKSPVGSAMGDFADCAMMELCR
jgi:hypothetical protein